MPPPQALDSCIAQVKGTPNKRTGKPSTESQAFAICTARLQASGVLRKGTQKLAKK